MHRAGVAVAVAAVGVVINAGIASAADGYVYTADNSGYADWIENGDTLTVCDRVADSWGTRAYIYVPDSPGSANGTVLIKGDDPKTTDGDGCHSFAKDISETTRLSLKVCNFKASAIANCRHTSLR